jgi:predicted NUDIX family NTP pyrophosphohydrolase
MAARHSAGLLLFRRARAGGLEVLLAHMGGPFWARRETGAWTIPKGELGAREDPLAAARREFREELGHEAPDGEPIDLGTVVQGNRKRVRAWAIEGDLDATRISSNTFEFEWPPRSGRRASFPEVDRADWFCLQDARRVLVKGQATLVDRLAEVAGDSDARAGEAGEDGASA